MASSLIIVESFLNAVTTEGRLALLENGFGIAADHPTTAALILQPQNLLNGPILSALDLAALTLDALSEKSVNFSVQLAGTSGVVVASWNVTLTITAGSQPVGMALFGGSTLFYVSAFSSWPSGDRGSFAWNGKITLGSCLGG